MEHGEALSLALASLFLLGVSAQWIAARLKLPSILFLLGFGILAGPVTGIIQPDRMLGDTLFPIVSLAVAIILFEGSFNLRFRELGGIGGVLLSLLTVGVAVTWTGATLAAHILLGFGWLKSLLLGAVLVVTGPTVIGPLLRQIRPIGRVGSIARWEGIIIDPIGAVLAVFVFEVGTSIRTAGLDEASSAVMAATFGLLTTAVVDGGIGALGALGLGWLLRRHEIPDYLESSVALIFVVAGFTGANVIQPESGLVAVTAMGVILANQSRTNMHHILEFKENLSLLLVSTLFILLSARLQFGAFGNLGWGAAAFLAVMIIVVRPLCVWLSAIGSTLSGREKVFLSWLAPRGIVAAAVSSVFALRMGEEGAGLVPATFLVIIGTVCIYGFTAQPLAKRLGLAVADPQGLLIAGAHAGIRAIAHALKDAGFTVLLVDTNHWNIQAARMEGLSTREGNILSEHLVEQIDLGGIGRFLAMTPNDEVNSLAALHLSSVFGRSNVFQLFPRQRSERKEAAPANVRARLLFGKDVTAAALDQRFEQGAVVKTTKLTEEFNFAAFQQRYHNTALLLFVVTETGRLEICDLDEALLPKPGQMVMAIVDPMDEPVVPSDDSPAHDS